MTRSDHHPRHRCITDGGGAEGHDVHLIPILIDAMVPGMARLAQPVIKIPVLSPKILHRKSSLKVIILTILLELPV